MFEINAKTKLGIQQQQQQPKYQKKMIHKKKS